jgi:site-specific recombinase XerD
VGVRAGTTEKEAVLVAWAFLEDGSRHALINFSTDRANRPTDMMQSFVNATLMLRNQANIRHTQELLAHASLDSPRVYAAVSIVDLKEVHSRFHPRERDKE